MMLLGEPKYPSLQEIHFELTENMISSPLPPRNPPAPSRVQLEYTQSLISIEHELEDQVPSFLDGLPYSSLKDKQSGYITASTRHTLGSVKTTFHTIKIRTQSCRQHASLQKIRATLAVCPIQFDEHASSEMACHRKANSKEKFRLRKSVSTRQRRNSENLPLSSNRFMAEPLKTELAKDKILKKVFKVKTINLEQNEARGKIYMKKIIQNRASILHLSETCQQSPWETKRSNFRM